MIHAKRIMAASFHILDCLGVEACPTLHNQARAQARFGYAHAPDGATARCALDAPWHESDAVWLEAP